MKYSRYHLTPLKDLNAFSKKGSIRSGVLVEFEGSYFDYHPWSEFGDESVDDFLNSLKQEGPSPLIKKFYALWMRKDKIHSHPFYNHTLNSFGKTVKLKYTTKEELDLYLSRESCQKLRIDFNNLLSFNAIKELWNSLSIIDRNKVDYFEDPFPKDEKWKELSELGIPLACDRNLKDGKNYLFDIYKPNVDLLPSQDKCQIFSSYMGHDLGRYLCFLELMDRGDLDLVHGIDTPSLFEEQLDLFSRQDDLVTINSESLNALLSELKTRTWEKL